MPITEQKYLNPTTEMALWKITETAAELKEQLWMFEAEEFKFESRNQHWLASRLLLQHLLQQKTDLKRLTLNKTANGKPFVQELDRHISISHSGNYAAAIVSENLSVGIDIEEITDRIKKIAHKFINNEEKKHLHGDHDLDGMYLLWAAKEAAFKWYGRGEVDFREHLHLHLYKEVEKNCYRLEIRKDDGAELDIYEEIIDDKYRLCWVAG